MSNAINHVCRSYLQRALYKKNNFHISVGMFDNRYISRLMVDIYVYLIFTT